MRTSVIKRKTKETEIELSLNLDGKGNCTVDTGVGFLDHMLELFAKHGNFDLTVTCKGDLKVDAHHTAEDIGIVLGKAINESLGNKIGIARYAAQYIPMDEALIAAYLDISGRPYLAYNLRLDGKVGDFDCELTEEFFRAVASYGLLTLHLRQLDGVNRHHIIEGAFKAFARALSQAVKIVDDRLPSTKGVIE